MGTTMSSMGTTTSSSGTDCFGGMASYADSSYSRCISNLSSYYSVGGDTDTTQAYVELKIYSCSNDSSITGCIANSSNLNGQQIWVSMPENFVSKENYETPIQSFLATKIKTSINLNFSKINEIYLKQLVVKTDTGRAIGDKYQTSTGIYADPIVEDSVKRVTTSDWSLEQLRLEFYSIARAREVRKGYRIFIDCLANYFGLLLLFIGLVKFQIDWYIYNSQILYIVNFVVRKYFGIDYNLGLWNLFIRKLYNKDWYTPKTYEEKVKYDTFNSVFEIVTKKLDVQDFLDNSFTIDTMKKVIFEDYQLVLQPYLTNCRIKEQAKKLMLKKNCAESWLKDDGGNCQDIQVFEALKKIDSMYFFCKILLKILGELAINPNQRKQITYKTKEELQLTSLTIYFKKKSIQN